MGQPELSSPITLKNRTLWFGELKLQGNKVVVSGWTWTGPVQEEIPLSNVTEFYKWAPTTTDEKGTPFVLRWETGSTIRGRIEKGIAPWAMELKDRGVKVEHHV